MPHKSYLPPDVVRVVQGAIPEATELLKQKFDLKQTTLSMDDEREATYLNRKLKVNNSGVILTGDPKHSELLLKEWGIQSISKEVNTPSLKELEDNICSGDEQQGEMATKVRRGVARVNYMAQDRPDLSSVAKVMSQHMSKPREGIIHILKRCVRYLKKYPVSSSLIPRGVRTCRRSGTGCVDRQRLGRRRGLEAIYQWRVYQVSRGGHDALVQNAIQCGLVQRRGGAQCDRQRSQ